MVRTYMLLVEALSDAVPAEGEWHFACRTSCPGRRVACITLTIAHNHLRVGSPEAGALDKVIEQLIAVVRKRKYVHSRHAPPRQTCFRLPRAPRASSSNTP